MLNHLTQDNFDKLAIAIITSAATDYKRAVRHIRCMERAGKITNRNYLADVRLRDEVVSFFMSDWFKLLTNVDPKFILDGIDAELEKEI